MKKIIASVGLAAVSAATAQAQYAPGLTPMETTKPWSVAASLRGFYDDNMFTAPAGPLRVGSWGTEVTPSVSFNHSVENTLLYANYIYDMEWYAQNSLTEQSHQFNGRLEHEFTDRYKISVLESFAYSQEPTVIDQTVVSFPYRTQGNNERNLGRIDFTGGLTKDLDLHLGYGNTIYHYQETESEVPGQPFYGGTYFTSPTSQTVTTVPGGGPPVTAYPSYSAELDRIEQLVTLDLRWKATPATTGVLGYELGNTAYTSPEYIIYPSTPTFPPYRGPNYEPIPAGATPTPGYYADSRDSWSHYAYVGADSSITPDLTGSIRVGIEDLDYYNYPGGRNQLSPYADANLTYQYTATGSAQLGVKHLHNSTDVVGIVGTTPVVDEESTVIYFSDTQKLSDRFSATAMGQAQLSSFDGGGPGYDGESERFFLLELNLEYHFNPWLAAEAGYNFTALRSDLPDRSFTRDFMYVGIRATY
jgi:hypothetical protein